MNTILSPKKLRLLIPGCGIAGALLRLLANSAAMDEKGLLIAHHPAVIALWVVTAAAAAALILGTRPIRGPESYQEAFPGSIPAALGCILAAVSAADAVTAHFEAGPAGVPNLMTTAAFYLTGVLMALACAAFVLAALCRLREKPTNFLLHVAACIYFALKLLNLYQHWSFDPQVFDYCFQLFACIALTMTAYQLAAFDIGKGSHRKLWLWGLAATYLGCLSCTGDLFFLTGGIWAWTNLTRLRIRRKRPEPTTETEG